MNQLKVSSFSCQSRPCGLRTILGEELYFGSGSCDSGIIRAALITQSDPVHFHRADILFVESRKPCVLVVGGIQIQKALAVRILDLDIYDGINSAVIYLFRDRIIGIVLLREAQRCIRAIAGKNVSARIVRVAGGIDFLAQSLHLFQDNLTVFCLQRTVKALGALLDHLRHNACQIIQGILGHGKPALRIRNVLGVVLGNLRHAATQPKCSDGHHRVIGGTVDFLLGGHLIAQLILVDFIGINIGQIVALHNLVGYSHCKPPDVLLYSGLKYQSIIYFG